MKVNEPAAIDWRGNRRGPFTVNLNLATQTTNWKQTRRTKPADTIPDCVDVFSCFRRAVNDARDCVHTVLQFILCTCILSVLCCIRGNPINQLKIITQIYVTSLTKVG